MAPGVPLEGSDTVEGLRTLERRHRVGAVPPEGAALCRRAAYARYRGPYLEQLPVDEFKRDPRPWSLFLRNGEQGRLANAYNVPPSLSALCERLEVRPQACGGAAHAKLGNSDRQRLPGNQLLLCSLSTAAAGPCSRRTLWSTCPTTCACRRWW